MSARPPRIARWSLLLVLILAVALGPSYPEVSPVALAQATITSIQFANFDSTAGISLVGAARTATGTTGDSIRLASQTVCCQGSAWFGIEQYVESGFETTFQFRIN